MHLCRNVDWGTAPQWAAVVVAAIVGGFSIWGIITARNSYKMSVKDTHESQARLVYGRIVSVAFFEKGASILDVKKSASLQGEGMRLLDDENNPILFMEQDRAYFTLGVVNSSKELIGDVRMGVVHGGTLEPDEWVRTGVEVVDPESAHEYTVGVVDKWHGSYSLLPVVEFRDSGGTKWRRIGSRPVQELDE